MQDARGATPLLIACQYGHQGLVAFLVSKNAKIDIEDKNGDTCLHWVKLISEYFLKFWDKTNSFHLKAAYRGFPDLTRLLVIYGVYPKKIDIFGQTVLHMACLGGNLNIVQQFIEQVNFVDNKNLFNYIEPIFQKDNIDPEICDKKGKKAIDLARSAKHFDVVEYIERNYRNRRNYSITLK